MCVKIDNGNSGFIEIYFHDMIDLCGWVRYQSPHSGDVVHHFDFFNHLPQLTTFTNGSLSVGIYRPAFSNENREDPEYWTIYITLKLAMLNADASVKTEREYCWAVLSEKVVCMGFAELEQASYVHCPECQMIILKHDRGHKMSCNSHSIRHKKK